MVPSSPPPPAPVNANESAVSIRHALEVAEHALSAVPALVNSFYDVPFSTRTHTLAVPDNQRRALDETGVLAGAQDPDPQSRVPKMQAAYWRDQVPTRPALPASTRVWLPSEFHVQSTLGTNAPRHGVAVLGYNYFHGNLVGGGLFIATQSPPVHRQPVGQMRTPYTFDARADFWIAVRTKNVRGVVMLADWGEGAEDGMDAVVPYLPLSAGETAEYYAYTGGFPVSDVEIGKGNRGDWRVRVRVTTSAMTINEKFGVVIRDVQASYAVRHRTQNGMIELIEDDTPHNLRHFHYTRWPDGGMPNDPGDILGLVQIASNAVLQNTPNEPTMVHCLAGHGRTGTLLTALVSVRSHHPRMPSVMSEHLFQTFSRLRNDRYYLVANQIQLLFSFVCYITIIKAIQENNPNALAIDAVRKIHAKLTNTRPSASIACVHCIEAIPSYAAVIRMPVCNVLTNFCSHACATTYQARNGDAEEAIHNSNDTLNGAW